MRKAVAFTGKMEYDAPNVYFGKVLKHCDAGTIAFGNISDREALSENLSEKAIPEGVVNMTVADYNDFLVERRKLMARQIEQYYKAL